MNMHSVPDQPNILFILTDQQSASLMSCAGNSWLSTPSMDSIAARGMKFENAYATNPVCIPSRFSLMTGKMPSAIGMKDNALEGVDHWSSENIRESLGNMLSRNGYDCWYGGKVHLPHNMNPETLGYKIYSDGEKGERKELGLKTAELIYKNSQKSDPHQRPWFITASFINPHDICHLAIDELGTSSLSRILKEKCITEKESVYRHVETYDSQKCPPLPENHAIQKNEPEAIQWLLRERPFRKDAREKWGEEDWKKHRWAYHRLTESVDMDMAPIIEALDRTGEWENTVVIFTSDHGDMDSSHKLEHKTVFYNEAVKIPMIVADPKGKTATCEKTVVSNGLDIYPTICAYAGITDSLQRDGISLKGLIQKNIIPERTYVPVENQIGRAIVSQEYLYALYDFGTNREQLYDLSRDPLQTENFACKEGYEKKVIEYRKALRKTFRRLECDC